MTDRPDIRDLPDHIRLIVEEIESEIGDDEPGRPATAIRDERPDRGRGARDPVRDR